MRSNLARRILVISAIILLHVGCSVSSQPSEGLAPADQGNMFSPPLSVVEVAFNPNDPSNVFRYLYPVDSPNLRPPLKFQRLISSGVVANGDQKYVWSKIEFSNVSDSQFRNVSLYAVNRASSAIGGTAFDKMFSDTGAALHDEVIARSILGSHGMKKTGNGFNVVSTEANFQIYLPYEAQSIEDEMKLMGALADQDDVLEYGYVLQNADGGPDIGPGQSAFVTIGAIVNKIGQSATPSRWWGTFVLTSSEISRVSQGIGESVEEVLTRAQNSDSEAVLINHKGYMSNPKLHMWNIRSFSTFQAPDKPEGWIDSRGGTLKLGQVKVEIPEGSTTGTTFKIEKLDTLPAPLPFELGGSINSDREMNAVSYRLSSKIALDSLETAIRLIIPNKQLSLGRDEIVSLLVFDGSKYIPIRIEKSARGFHLEIARLNGTAKALEYRAGVVFSIITRGRDAVVGACVGAGGYFNGMYCEYPFKETPVSPGQALKVLSFNVGNALQSGVFNELNFCGNYAYKLCSIAIESSVREVIRAENPDIIALQEVWNDRCNYIEDHGQMQVDYLPSYWEPKVIATFVSHERICDKAISTSLQKPRQIDRLLPSNIYETKCSPIRGFLKGAPTQRLTNGYECVGIRRSLLEFIESTDQTKEVIQPPCNEVVAPESNEYWVGSDTGFQVASIQLRDPLGKSGSTFDLVNSHMISLSSHECRAKQLAALYRRYHTKGVNPDPRRLLIAGDMNTDPNTDVSFVRDDGRSYFNQIFTSFSQKETHIAPQLKMAYLLSDPSQPTAKGTAYNNQFVPRFPWPPNPGSFRDVSLDHVLSNFADGSCSRGEVVRGLDHLRTRCLLIGFDSGANIRAGMQLWDLSVIGPVDYLPWKGGSVRVSKRGVPITYMTHTSGSPIYDSYGIPNDVEVSFEYRACDYGAVQTKLGKVAAGQGMSFGTLKFTEWLPICRP